MPALSTATQETLGKCVERGLKQGVDILGRLQALDCSAVLPSVLRDGLRQGEFELDLRELEVLCQDQFFAADPPLFSMGKNEESHVGKVSVDKLRDFVALQTRAIVDDALEGLTLRAASAGADITTSLKNLAAKQAHADENAVRNALTVGHAGEPLAGEIGCIMVAKQFKAKKQAAGSSDVREVSVQKLYEEVAQRTARVVDTALRAMTLRALRHGVMLVDELAPGQGRGVSQLSVEDLSKKLTVSGFEPTEDEMGCIVACPGFTVAGSPEEQRLIDVPKLRESVAGDFDSAVEGRVGDVVHRTLRCGFDLAGLLRGAMPGRSGGTYTGAAVEDEGGVFGELRDDESFGMNSQQLQELMCRSPLISAEDVGCIAASARFRLQSSSHAPQLGSSRLIDVAALEHFVRSELLHVECFEWMVRSGLRELAVRGKRAKLDLRMFQSMLCPNRAAHDELDVDQMCRALRQGVHELGRRAADAKRRSARTSGSAAPKEERCAVVARRLGALLEREAPDGRMTPEQQRRLTTVLLRMKCLGAAQVEQYDDIVATVTVAEFVRFVRSPRVAPHCFDARMHTLHNPTSSAGGGRGTIELVTALRDKDLGNAGYIDARSVAAVLHARGLRLPEEEQREILRLILSCFAARGGAQLLDYRDFATFLRPPLFVLHVFTPFTKLELRVAPGETVSDIRLRIQRRLFWQQHSASGAAGFDKGDQAKPSIGSDFLIYRHCGTLKMRCENIMHKQASLAFVNGEMLFVVDPSAHSSGFVFRGEVDDEVLVQQQQLQKQPPTPKPDTTSVAQTRQREEGKKRSAEDERERLAALSKPRPRVRPQSQESLHVRRAAQRKKKSFAVWSPADVQHWLTHEIELPSSVAVKLKHMNGAELLTLNDSKLRDKEIGSSLHRRKILQRLSKYRAEARAEAAISQDWEVRRAENMAAPPRRAVTADAKAPGRDAKAVTGNDASAASRAPAHDVRASAKQKSSGPAVAEHKRSAHPLRDDGKADGGASGNDRGQSKHEEKGLAGEQAVDEDESKAQHVAPPKRAHKYREPRHNEHKHMLRELADDANRADAKQQVNERLAMVNKQAAAAAVKRPRSAKTTEQNRRKQFEAKRLELQDIIMELTETKKEQETVLDDLIGNHLPGSDRPMSRGALEQLKRFVDSTLEKHGTAAAAARDRAVLQRIEQVGAWHKSVGEQPSARSLHDEVARINTLLDFVKVMQPDIAEHDKHISEICDGLLNRHDQYTAALETGTSGV